MTNETQVAAQPATEEPALIKWLRRVSRTDWTIIAMVLTTKVVLFFYGYHAFRTLEDKEPAGSHPWLEMWNRWDSIQYQKLAQSGYQNASVWKAWFYPMYPWATRVFGRICDDYLVGAFLVSGIASVAVGMLLYRLCRLEFSSAVSWRALGFFLIFPTAYFLHIGYTESLFLAFALGSILAARRDKWWLAGILGALSWAARASGMVLLPTLAVEALCRYWKTRQWQWRWLWIGLIPAGLGLYLWLNWHVTGDAFTFLHMQKSLAARSFGWPWIGIKEAWGNTHRAPNQSEIVGYQEFFFVLLTLVCVVVSWFRTSPTYATWITCSWVLYNSVRFLESGPRYALTMFPMFILFGLVARNRVWNLVITMWSVLFLALFVALFVRGWWAF